MRSIPRGAPARFFRGRPHLTEPQKLGMSAMTASSSKPSIHRQPHTIPLPFSPEKSATHHGSHKRRKAGKEREGNPPRRVRSGSDAEWDHTRAGTKPWHWTSLTESSASNHPPVFSRDVRRVLKQNRDLLLQRSLNVYFERQIFFCDRRVIHQDLLLLNRSDRVHFIWVVCWLWTCKPVRYHHFGNS